MLERLKRVFVKVPATPTAQPFQPAGMTKEQRYAAIAQAKTVAGLRELWDAWEATGSSREGLLYARVLERTQTLGEPLLPEERETISLAAQRRAHGKTLPPITGRMKGA